MLKQIEGSRAVADSVAMCRPRVICAYPITPQTHMVEALGARAYTATASQGLLYISEAVYNAAGLGLPVVMTVADRAIGAPINICNDHSDAMSQRDAGWIQLYAETNQEAADLHIQAFRIAEELSNPVMVCMDGFLLTHASERVDLPKQEQVDAFLPPYEPRQVLDPDDPVPIGAMVGPETFTEVRSVPCPGGARRAWRRRPPAAPGRARAVARAGRRRRRPRGPQDGASDRRGRTQGRDHLDGHRRPRRPARHPSVATQHAHPRRAPSPKNVPLIAMAHEILFRPEERTDVIARIQASADRNLSRFGLLQDHPERTRPALPAHGAPSAPVPEQP